MKKFIITLVTREINADNSTTISVFDTEQKAKEDYYLQLKDLIADNNELKEEIEEDSNFANDCILSARDPQDNWWLYLQEVDFQDKTEEKLLEDKLQYVANGFIDYKCDFDGVKETIACLVNDYCFTKEELLKLHFDKDDIDEVLDGEEEK